MTFLEKIAAFFSGENPETKNKKILKKIAIEINKNKYRKFYKSGSAEINPILGDFFYDIYKTLAPFQVFMKNAAKSALLKQLTIEAFMDKDLREVYKRLFPEFIQEKVKTMPPEELSRQLEQDMTVFSSAFSNNRIQTVNQCYNLILNFGRFVEFDFFSILKKMDPLLREHNFKYQPQFKRVSGKYLVADLKDFLEIPLSSTKWEDWNILFEILKKYKNGGEGININQWKKQLSYIQDVQKSEIMVLIVRHIEKNMNWQKGFQQFDESIVEPYLQAKKDEIHGCIDKIIHDRLDTKRDSLAEVLFGSITITRLQYYTESANEMYLKKDLEGFIYIRALNYLKAFLLDNDIRELCDIFLVRGQWSSQELSRRMSQELHEITDISEQLSNFDESLSEGGHNGIKLKSHIIKSKVDRNQIAHLKIVLGTINDEALVMINNAVSAFNTVGLHLKELYDDYTKPHPSLVVNWKEIESVSETPINQRLQQSYETIVSFVHLMQLFIP